MNKNLPEEVDYLTKYDLLNNFIKNYIDMPDKLVDLLIRFLNQNNGKFSKRARDKEFSELTEDEVQTIERKYDDIIHSGCSFPRGRVGVIVKWATLQLMERAYLHPASVTWILCLPQKTECLLDVLIQLVYVL